MHGSAQVWLELPPEKFRINVIVADTPAADVILGRDFLRSQKCTIEMGSTSDVLHIKTQGQRVAITQDLPDTVSPGTASLNVVLQEPLTIPPRSEVEVIGSTLHTAAQKPWTVQGRRCQRCVVMVARALVEPQGNRIPIRLLNLRDVEISIIKGTIVAELESVPDSSLVSVVLQHPEDEPSEEHRCRLWEMVVEAEQSLMEEEKAQLFALLLKYHTLLATGDDDLGHTAKVQHRINTGEAFPIRQSARRIT